MKTNQFLFAALTAAFLSVANYAAAQVTIGGGDPPKAGAILDLNSSSGEKGGLLLSNVSITNLNAIPYDVDTDVFPGITSTNHDTEKGKLAGMIVWNTNDEFPINGDGIYIWDGNKWNYIGGSDGVHIPTGVGTFSGKLCFDIATGNSGINGCNTIATRTQKTVFTNRTSQDGAAAPYSGVQVYTFTPSGTVNNVRFGFNEAVGAGKIVESIVPSADYSGTVSSAQVTVNYKSSLQNDLSGLTRNTGLKLKLYVIYNDGNADRAIELNTSLQDCACCGAKVSSTEWRDFMCHNLGANEAADPFTPAAEIHGAIYQFGIKDTAISQATHIAITGVISWWKSNYTTGNWDMTTANPCPSGWRLPTITEWQGVIDYNNEYRTNDGGQNWTAANVTQTWPANIEDFNNGIKFGDALVLPAAGYRGEDNGMLTDRGYYGVYWSSTVSGSYGYYMCFRGFDQLVTSYKQPRGYSVRCLSE